MSSRPPGLNMRSSLASSTTLTEYNLAACHLRVLWSLVLHLCLLMHGKLSHYTRPEPIPSIRQAKKRLCSRRDKVASMISTGTVMCFGSAASLPLKAVANSLAVAHAVLNFTIQHLTADVILLHHLIIIIIIAPI